MFQSDEYSPKSHLLLKHCHSINFANSVTDKSIDTSGRGYEDLHKIIKVPAYKIMNIDNQMGTTFVIEC